MDNKKSGMYKNSILTEFAILLPLCLTLPFTFSWSCCLRKRVKIKSCIWVKLQHGDTWLSWWRSTLYEGFHIRYLFTTIYKDLFVYLGFNVAFNTVQVISRRVVGRAEETST